MWYDIFWIFLIVVSGLFVAATVVNMLYEKVHRKEKDNELCAFDFLIIDSTVDFLAKTMDSYPLKEGETKYQSLFLRSQQIAKDRLIKAGMKINDQTEPLIDRRLQFRIHELEKAAENPR